MKNQPQGAQQQKPAQDDQIDGIFSKRKEHVASSKAAGRHPPIPIP